MTVRFGKVVYRLDPGAKTTLRFSVDRRGPWSLPFSAAGGSFRPDLRAVSVLSTHPRFIRAGEHGVRARSIAA